MRKLLASAAIVLLGAAGCAPTTIRVYDEPGGAPRLVPLAAHPELDPRGEPAVCLFAWHGNHFMGELGALRDSGQFRSLLLLTEDHLDPDGCGVLLSIRQGGTRTNSSGTSFVDVYSPYGGEQVLRAQAEGVGAFFGFRSVAYYLKTELQEGRPLRMKLDELKKSKPLIDEDEVEKLAEGEPLTWDGLIAATSSPYEKEQLEASKASSESAEEADDADDEDDSGDGESGKGSTSAPAEKPWWSKP